MLNADIHTGRPHRKIVLAGEVVFKIICQYLSLQHVSTEMKKTIIILWSNPGRFGPGSFRPESFRPGSFRPILGVGRFGLGRWVVSANFLGESIRP